MLQQEARRVMLVEDDAVIRQALKEVLVDEGYQVEDAPHGRAALTRLRQGYHPCVMLLDLMMPVMDGWQLLDVMRHDDELMGIPVVVVSAVVGDAALPGTVRCMQKPIDLDVLLQEVESCCSRFPHSGCDVCRPAPT